MTQLPPRRALGAATAAVDLHRNWIGPRDWGVGLGRALRDAVRLNHRAFSPWLGARVALGVVIALVIGKAVGDPAAEASMAAGALLAGVSGVVNNSRTSLRSLSAVAVAMAVSTFVGSYSGELGWVHTAVLVPWCLAGGLLVGVGGVAVSIGTQSLAAMIVFGRFAEQPAAALHLASFVLAGGAIAVAVLGLTRPPVTSALQRRAIVTALASLTGLAQAGRTKRNGVASAETLEAAAALVGQAVRFDVDESVRLRALLGVARRSRLEILAIEGLGRRLLRLGGPDEMDGWAAVDDALATAGTVFSAFGVTLLSGSDDGAALDDFLTAEQGAHQALGHATRGAVPPLDPGMADALDGHLAALAGQLRAGRDLVQRIGPLRRSRRSATVGLRPPRFVSPSGVQEALDTLRAHATLRSPIGRHAVRLAIVVTGAEILALHTPLQRGYWVALTASVVLRPDFSVTFSRGLARMLGTSVGVILAGLLVIGVHSSGVVEIAAIAVLCLLACASFQVGYLLFTGFLTGLVVLLVGIVEPGTFATALERLIDTLVGGFLALAVYGLWPTWSSQRAPQAFAALAERQRAYLEAVLAAIGTTAVGTAEPAAVERLGGLARAARRAKADADDALVRSAEEPENHRFSLDTGQGILAALARISLACHALRADLEAGRPGRPMPEIATFAAAISRGLATARDQLDGLALESSPGPFGALRSARFDSASVDSRQQSASSSEVAGLRREHDAFSAALAGRDDVGPFLAETDELVDAIDTLDDVLKLRSA